MKHSPPSKILKDHPFSSLSFHHESRSTNTILHPKQKIGCDFPSPHPFLHLTQQLSKAKSDPTNSTQLGFFQFFKVDSTSLEKNWVWKSNQLVLQQRVQFDPPNGRSWTFPKVSLNFSSRTRRYSRNKTSSQWWGGERRVSGDTGSCCFFFGGESFLKTRKGTPQVVGANITKT